MGNKKKSELEISIVTPAYKTEKVIANTLINLKKTLDLLKVRYEIICVVDGRADRTYENAVKTLEKYPKIIRVYSYEKNRGKGFAVRYGFSKARGKLVGFIDSDGDIAPKSLLTLIQTINKVKSDGVVGSKNHKDSNIYYPFHRKLISYFTQILAKIMFNVGLSDTQAGVKIFTKNLVKVILPKLKVSRFAFDLELLAVAKKSGFKIKEAPIVVNMSPGKGRLGVSTISFKDLVYTLIETIGLFFRLNFTNFYQ